MGDMDAGLEHIITLMMGDTSGDGHCRTDRFVIRSNLDRHAIEGAFQRGTAIVGFNLTWMCEDFECNELEDEHCRKLEQHGFDTDVIFDAMFCKQNPDCVRDDAIGPQLSTDEYALIYLFIVGLGDPSFRYERCPDTTQAIDIGGYGLFYV